MHLAENKVTRSGTFLTQKVNVEHEHIFDRVQSLLTDLTFPFKSFPNLTEYQDCLLKIQSDLNSYEVSDVIKDHYKGHFELSHQEYDWLVRHDQSQWADYLVYRYRFKIYPAQKKLLDFPVHLLIEPTSVCNLRCVMCFQVDSSFTKSEYMGMMSLNLFKKVVDQAKAHNCNAVTLASRGEPTLNKDFGNMVRYLAEVGIMDIKINTNATKLTEKLCYDILDSGVSEVVFSVDAATKDTYEKIRVKGKFDEVVANIERFNEIRSRHYPNAPTVTRISGVLVNDEQDIQQMQSFWSKRVDQVTIKEAIPRWNSYNNALVNETNPCSQLWERMYVWYDGKVNPCDYDYKSLLSVGNASESDLSNLWLGEAYTRLRNEHLNKRRSCLNPCDRCSLY